MVAAVETMAWAGEVPWHGLGVKVSNDLTPEQMLKKAGLDWAVDLVPCYGEVGSKAEGRTRLKLPVKALVRSTDKKILSMVSKGWNPVQNHEAFEFFNDFVAAGDMEMHTAGSLRGGKIVWVLAKVKAGFTVGKGDEIHQYLLFTNPHNYGHRVDVRDTMTRVVCNNTLVQAFKGGSTRIVNFDHRIKFDPDRVKEALGIAKEHLNKYKEAAKFLSAKAFTPESMQAYFNEIFPRTSDAKGTKEPSQMFKLALQAMEKQPGAEMGEGTWWQPFNATTYLMDHVMGKTQDGRLHSSWYGYASRQKNVALKKAIEYAEAA